ncbi:MAG: SCO family protein [Bacteroidota bacterium]
MRLLAFLLLALLPGSVAAQDRPVVGIVERLGETVPLELEFYDEEGHLVTLGQVITKPTIVTFVYYRCPGICSPLLTELSGIVEKMDLEPGIDYQILTVSFDHRETPDLAASKKESYLTVMDRAVDPNAWRFFTGDSEAVFAFTDAAGFYFKPEGNDFVHAGALIVLSAEGKITRYINGIRYLPFDVKMAVIEAAEGKTGPTVAKLLRFCYSYDPEAKRYAFDITRVGAVAILLFVGVFVVVFLVKPKKKSEREVTHGQSS